MKPRKFETTIETLAHRVAVRWWGITGPVTDERLTEAAEERVRECIISDGYVSGQLVHDNGESSATGWWEIQR